MLLERFRVYVETELGLSPETLLAYTKDVEEFLAFIGAQELTAHTIDQFASHLLCRGVKEPTARRKIMSIRCFCHHLISLGELKRDILEAIPQFRKGRTIPDALDSSDINKLISTLLSNRTSAGTNNVCRNVAIVLILARSGLRVSELCNLNLKDINPNRRTIRVRGKGGRDRIVPTTQECIDAIDEYVVTHRSSHTNAIFVREDGERITRRNVSDMLMNLSRRAGIKHTTPHTLRRTCATMLMNNGMDVELVQTLLGHQHISTTQAYLATNDDRLTAVHRKCHPLGAEYAIWAR